MKPIRTHVRELNETSIKPHHGEFEQMSEVYICNALKLAVTRGRVREYEVRGEA